MHLPLLAAAACNRHRRRVAHLRQVVVHFRQVIVCPLLTTALLASYPCADAEATVMRRLTLPQLVSKADRIFVGEVLNTQAIKDGDYIVTDAEIKVEQTVVGRHQRTQIVRRLGGILNGIGMRVAGTPRLRKGQRAVFITTPRGGGRYVVAMSQGLFRLIRHKGVDYVRRDLNGISFTSGRIGKNGGPLGTKNGGPLGTKNGGPLGTTAPGAAGPSKTDGNVRKKTSTASKQTASKAPQTLPTLISMIRRARDACKRNPAPCR